jgi:N-glycosylase/DNA lyase
MFLDISNENRFAISNILRNFSEEKSPEDIFYNMCFCLCAPQTTYKSNRKVIDELIKRNFYNVCIDLSELRQIIKPVRFLRKAEYLLHAKDIFDDILEIISSCDDNFLKREKIVKKVKGFGYKAASHFLRNCGAIDLAIIDTHIIKFMGWKKFPKNKNQYLKLEKEFILTANKNNLTVAGLDAYIWKVRSGTSWENFVY